MITTRVEAIPAISRAEAEVLAATEYERFAEQLRSLGDDFARRITALGATGGHPDVTGESAEAVALTRPGRRGVAEDGSV